jgi:iron complex outermembrane receptor protein
VHRNVFRFVFIALALLTASSTIFATSDTATLSGTVSDSSGAPISQAVVRLHQAAGSALLTIESDRHGHFALTNVTPGQYLLDASAPGLVLARPETVIVQADETKIIALTLTVSAVRTQVSVTAADEPQSLDQVSKALDIVSVADAERRGIVSVSDAIRFLPGVRVTTRGGPGDFTSIETRGLTEQDTGVLIDGFRFRDPTSIQGDATAYISDLLLVDSSRIEVLRGSGSSLYGTNSVGGTVNIITDAGGGPFHGDLDLQGGGLGLFRGLARIAGGVDKNRLAYSLGVSNLSVTEGVADAGAVRDWSGQGGLDFALTPKIRLAADIFANTGFLQENVSPQPTATAPVTGIIPAVPISPAQIRLADANQVYDPGNATFVPSLGDPDAGRPAHFIDSLFRLEHEVTPHLSYRIGYSIVSEDRDNTDGPGGPGYYQPIFNTSDRYLGRIDTVQGRVNYLLGSHQILSAGYEFEQEHYLEVQTDQNPDPTQRAYYRTDARQRTNAAFAQDEIRLLNDRLDVLLSGRYTQASIDQPVFVNGGPSPYANAALPSPPSAYTGDASIAYFLPRSSTKLRAHAGNSFRLPSLYERFGGYLFQGYDFAYGDPRLSPERAVGIDFGFDQYLFHQRVKISASYFYTHLQQIVGFLSFPPGYIDPYGRTAGYYDTGGGISRGVELSGEFHPTRQTSIFGSYTFVNAKDRMSQYYTGTSVSPLQTPIVLPHGVSLIATQQLGKHIDLGLDFQGGSDYLYPLYGYAYRFSGPRQLGLSAGFTTSIKDRFETRFYVRVSNALNQAYFEEGFETPPRWAVGGIHVTF